MYTTNFDPGLAVPIPTLLVVVSVDVVMVDVALMELALNVEYAATPGGPLLILDTVKVDRVILLDVMVDVVRVDPLIALVVIDEPVIVE